MCNASSVTTQSNFADNRGENNDDFKVKDIRKILGPRSELNLSRNVKQVQIAVVCEFSTEAEMTREAH